MQDLVLSYGAGNNLHLISNFTPSGGILVQTPIEGLDSPNYRNNSFSNPGRHGVSVSSQFYDARIINLTGQINGSTPAAYEAYRSQLSQAVQIQKDASGYPLPVRMTFITMAGTSYFADIFFDKPTFSIGSPMYCDFQVTGTVANPFIFGVSPVGTGVIYPPTAGGRITPTITPYTTTASTGGNNISYNPGVETALPIIYIYGSITNPVITNMTTGKVMRLTYTVAAGDQVAIDMYNQLITLNHSSSLISTKSIDSDWWGVIPGNNVISLSTGSTSDSGYIAGNYYAPYVGI